MRRIVSFFITLVMLSSMLVSCGGTNPYKQYTDLLGKSCKKISDEFDQEQNLLAGDFWTANAVLDELDFPNVSGTLTYHYTSTGLSEYSTDSFEIHKMEWIPHYLNITATMVEDTLEHLNSIYGKYDEVKGFTNNDSMYAFRDNDFHADRYFWEEREYTVCLAIEYDEVTATEIIITWSNK